MDHDELQVKAPRKLEVVIGLVLAVISLLFFFLVAYFAIVIYEKNTFGIETIFIEAILAAIGAGLSLLSYRLITGKGAKGTKSLFTANTFILFGLFFGVAGVVGLGVGIFDIDAKLILTSLLGLVTSYSLVKLGKKQKSRTDGL